ncbi:class 1 isoprenoid biosynthesis enzyme [Phaeocystidibacter luteus]|uniref:Class 1 isoprenoid biosynthesis enzyme n=1 Tax=Phaeocystidibacter luteus TaxID=911197 RepID=A0A6N6RJT0_9FLAO|nr:class 1 isoprenoid biosynthesis enzyme [Phaeocystidibacter luteus]KAB2808038.1 class 1 isoprenoid biosynthesis enzyme [Phaeocystidibacter luteus]
MSSPIQTGYLQVGIEFFRLAREIVFGTRKANRRTVEELNTHLKSVGSNLLTDQERKRIAAYVAQNSIVNLHTRLLHGVPVLKRDQKYGAYFGAFTPFMDDAMDDGRKTYREVIDEVEASPELHPSLAYLWRPVKEILDTNETFHRFYQDTIVAQNESVSQNESTPLTFEELVKITEKKGGSSTLLYRSIATHELYPEEERALHALGGVYQLLNDIFDFYKDTQSGQQTIVTNRPDFFFIRELLDEKVREFLHLFDEIPASRRGKKRALASISIILARGFVACDQYQRLQRDSRFLVVRGRERKELIVDMEKPQNLLKSLSYAARIRKISTDN